MTKIKCSCVNCQSIVTTSNIGKHFKSKTCLTGGITRNNSNGNCPYCDLDISSMNFSSKGNHVRWCLENPKREQYISDYITRMNNSPSVKEARAAGISMAHTRGAYAGSAKKSVATRKLNGTNKHTAESKLKISKAARASNHQRVCKSSHYYTDKLGRTFKFDSTWEDALADRLDFINVRWERPLPIPYIINGKEHKYFPDFYLPDYDIYLDPKNSYCREKQKEKIDIVSSIINLKILHSVDECKNFQVIA